MTISSGSKHDLYYDYYGFPSEAYQIKYDAPGDSGIARLASKKLAEAGIQSELDPERGTYLLQSLPRIHRKKRGLAMRYHVPFLSDIATSSPKAGTTASSSP